MKQSDESSSGPLTNAPAALFSKRQFDPFTAIRREEGAHHA
jgi:hypothetical protein